MAHFFSLVAHFFFCAARTEMSQALGRFSKRSLGFINHFNIDAFGAARLCRLLPTGRKNKIERWCNQIERWCNQIVFRCNQNAFRCNQKITHARVSCARKGGHSGCTAGKSSHATAKAGFQNRVSNLMYSRNKPLESYRPHPRPLPLKGGERLRLRCP